MKAGRNRLFRADGADARIISLEEYSRYDTTGLAELVATALAAVEKVNPRINAVVQNLGDEATAVRGSPSSGARRRLRSRAEIRLLAADLFTDDVRSDVTR